MQATPLVRLFAVGSAVLLMAACASTPLEEKPAPVVERSAPPAAAPTPPPAPDARAVARVDTTSARPLDPLTDPANILSKREVFFDFDSFLVKSEFLPLVEGHGRYLVANKQRRIVIEGNADERGSREYNLALGQKRADAVKSRLTLLGVAEAQIESVSLGEEKPRATSQDEAGWAQNRRADIVYR